MYKINKEKNEIQKLTQTTFTELKMKERYDIQEWIFKCPEILGEEDQLLLIIAKELPVNDIGRSIRLDLLALDREGSLVIIELKRDSTRGDIDWQAIKYAARCSKFTPEDILNLYCKTKYGSEFNFEQRKESMMEILEHIDGESISSDVAALESSYADIFRPTPEGRLNTKIMLVAQDFHPDICAAALWLRDNGIDISCTRLNPYKDGEAATFIDSERIIPIPETEDYINHPIVSRRRSQYTSGHDSEKRNIFGTDIMEEITEDDVKKRLKESLGRQTNLTPRLAEFLRVLSSKEGDGFVDRSEIISTFTTENIASNQGQAGRLLSNVSQFITKPKNSYLRSIIDYDTGERGNVPGARKNKFRIKDKFKMAVREVLDEARNE